MAEAELRRHRIRLKLQEKPFQLLAKRLERPGTVVSREELREKPWTDDTYVDFERSLNVAISKLRAALVLACCGLSRMVRKALLVENAADLWRGSKGSDPPFGSTF